MFQPALSLFSKHLLSSRQAIHLYYLSSIRIFVVVGSQCMCVVQLPLDNHELLFLIMSHRLATKSHFSSVTISCLY